MEEDQKQKKLTRNYKIILPIIGLGGFLLFYFSASSMIKILEYATILSFLTSPIIAFFNLRAITSDDISVPFYPSKKLIYLAYLGLVANVLFAVFYVFSLV